MGTSAPPDCTLCPLAVGRTQVVQAEGSPNARVFVVGEAPGPDEDKQGRPFVGRAGQILRKALADAGFAADEVWITNSVKCFPHTRVEGKAKIRAPTVQESDACRAHLAAEVRTLRPRLVVALGRTAAATLLGTKAGPMAAMRGMVVPARAELEGVDVFVTYHPSGLHYGHATVEEFTGDLRSARELAQAVRA